MIQRILALALTAASIALVAGCSRGALSKTAQTISTTTPAQKSRVAMPPRKKRPTWGPIGPTTPASMMPHEAEAGIKRRRPAGARMGIG